MFMVRNAVETPIDATRLHLSPPEYCHYYQHVVHYCIETLFCDNRKNYLLQKRVGRFMISSMVGTVRVGTYLPVYNLAAHYY